jgi:uncharacterized protein (DUF1330 family)
MPAYLIANVDVKDPDRYDAYRQDVPASIERFGGRYLARGGTADVLEGTWPVKRLVIVEFPSRERAMAWWSSDDYASLKALRQATADSQLVIVDGL